MKTKYKYITAAALIALLPWSCVREHIDILPAADGSTEVSIDVLMPGTDFGAETRSLTAAGENQVEDITVLVFDASGVFQYRADARTVESTGEDNVKRFSVKLKTGSCDLWIFANCKDIIDAYPIPANATKGTLRGNLLLQINGNWNTVSGFTPLPMWGERTGVNVTPNLSLTGTGNRVPLIRAVAKVDVTIDRSAVPDADFTIQGVWFYHWSDQGQIVPDQAVLSSDKTKVTAISGNTGSTAETQYQSYGPSERDADGFFTNLIYVPETAAGSTDGTTNPCLLINGIYEGISGWYKLEFIDDNTSGDIDRYLPLLRNYRYEFQITGVGGRGYGTPQEAYKSKSENLIVRLLNHSDATLTNVMYDGNYWLGWDPDRFELDKEVHNPTDDGHNLLQIETNCEDGWRFQRIEYPAGQPTGWLSIPAAEQSGAKGTRGRVHLVTTENTGSPRTARVHFTAGRMDMSMEVYQSDESNMEILLLDADGNPLGDIYWVNTVERKIQERTIRVKWIPVEGEMSVTFAVDNFANAKEVKYETGGGIPAGPVQGEGLHEYRLRLSELNTEDDYDFDAGVIQPYRTRYTFTLDYHGKKITKQLVIAHHLEFFNLYRYQPEGYLMGLLNWDQSFCFEASAPFIAELSNDYPGLFSFFQGLHGNFTEGFNPEYAKGREGYFNIFEWYINAKNPTPERRHQYETVTIKFPDSELPDTTIILKTLNLLPNCYIAPPGSSVQVPVRNPWDARFQGIPIKERMPLPELPTTGNFTCELLWEDVDGLIDDVIFTPAHIFDPYRTEMTVKTNGGRGEGNAVVALRRNGVIIWSWHIWVTAFDPDAKTYTYNNSDPLYMMDRNLGATADRNNTQENRLKSVGLYYQGGRKDPFPPLGSIPGGQQETPALSNHKQVYPDNNIFKVERYLPANEEQSLLRTIENPTTFIYEPTPPYDWYRNNGQHARWALYHNDTDEFGGTIINAKSIYDPCPEGWMVPNGETKAPWRPQIWGPLGTGGNFLPDGNTATIPGNFGIITAFGDFYPASGFIDYTDGTYREVGYNVLVPIGKFGMVGQSYQISVMEYPVGRPMGYTLSPYATGMNVRCMKIDYYKPEND